MCVCTWAKAPWGMPWHIYGGQKTTHDIRSFTFLQLTRTVSQTQNDRSQKARLVYVGTSTVCVLGVHLSSKSSPQPYFQFLNTIGAIIWVRIPQGPDVKGFFPGVSLLGDRNFERWSLWKVIRHWGCAHRELCFYLVPYCCDKITWPEKHRGENTNFTFSSRWQSIIPERSEQQEFSRAGPITSITKLS